MEGWSPRRLGHWATMPVCSGGGMGREAFSLEIETGPPQWQNRRRSRSPFLPPPAQRTRWRKGRRRKPGAPAHRKAPGEATFNDPVRDNG